MAIDLLSVFGDTSYDYFKSILYRMMRNELIVSASAASTEEDKSVYNKLTHNLLAEVKFNTGGISAKAEIDISKLSAEFLSKNRGLIDLVNNNFEKKIAFFIESEIYNMLDWSDVQQRIVESAQSDIVEELSTLLGGMS